MKTKWWMALAFSLALVLGLAACGGGGAPEAEADEEPAAFEVDPNLEPRSVEINVRSTDPNLGMFLVDGDGITLYKSYADETDVSNCDAACQEQWPPVLVDSPDSLILGSKIWLEGKMGTIPGPDGYLQVTFRGRPLYYSVLDSAPGDINGQAIDENWYVVSPTSN